MKFSSEHYYKLHQAVVNSLEGFIDVECEDFRFDCYVEFYWETECFPEGRFEVVSEATVKHLRIFSETPIEEFDPVRLQKFNPPAIVIQPVEIILEHE